MSCRQQLNTAQGQPAYPMSEIDRLTIAKAALRASPVFASLPAAAVAQLAAVSRLERYKVPTLLASAGTQVDLLRYVMAGQVVLKQRAADGSEVAYGAIRSGHWAAWLPCFTDDPLTQDYWSSEDAEYLAFPNGEVRAVADRHPEIYRQAIGEIGQRFRNVLEWVWQSTITAGEARAARLLLFYCGPTPRDENIRITATQDSLARIAGCSRQTLNRLLLALERRGLITVGYGHVVIHDRRTLRQFAEETR